MPQSIAEAEALKAWAKAHIEIPIVATAAQMTQHLTFMAATLPSKNIDDDSGRMKIAVYARLLRGYTNEALSHMALRACSELDWFPAPRQCIEFAESYRPPLGDKERALQLCHRFFQGRFEAFVADLKGRLIDQATVDAAPLHWRQIAMEQGYLRWQPDDEKYIIRDSAR